MIASVLFYFPITNHFLTIKYVTPSHISGLNSQIVEVNILVKYLLIVVLIVSSTLFVKAQNTTTTFSLTDVYYALTTVDDLESRGILSSSEAQAERSYYLAQAETLTGKSITRHELESQLFDDTSWWRFISFVNIIWVFASLIIVLSLSLLFVRYIVPLLKMIPIVVYEIILYLACIGLIYGGQFVTATASQFVAFPGVLGFAILLPFSYKRRQPEHWEELNYEHIKRPIIVQNLILMTIWGVTAIAYNSQLIGFMTVVVLMVTVTATRAIPALLASIGMDDNSAGRELLVMSFLLLLTYIIMEIRDIVGVYHVFEVGVHWLGAYGFFGALEWMSSRWRKTQSMKSYIYWQVVAVLSGVGAIFIGQLFEIEALTEVGGTFLLVYILSKYIEIPNLRQYWLWATLGLGLILYMIALVINQYPELFLFS